MINYPNKKNDKQSIKDVPGRNGGIAVRSKGMGFEEMINRSNEFYLLNDIAIIHKRPTPIRVVKVNVQKDLFEKRHRITEAYYESRSTTDYNGIYRGRYIDFEAKQTKYNTFNVGSNLHDHQLNHLERVRSQGGIAFLLVDFLKFDRTYLLEIEQISRFLEREKGKSQIPLEYFEENGFLIERKYNPQLDYLKVVETLI